MMWEVVLLGAYAMRREAFRPYVVCCVRRAALYLTPAHVSYRALAMNGSHPSVSTAVRLHKEDAMRSYIGLGGTPSSGHISGPSASKRVSSKTHAYIRCRRYDVDSERHVGKKVTNKQTKRRTPMTLAWNLMAVQNASATNGRRLMFRAYLFRCGTHACLPRLRILNKQTNKQINKRPLKCQARLIDLGQLQLHSCGECSQTDCVALVREHSATRQAFAHYCP